MRIYTSYFAMVSKLEKNGIFPIGISAFPPAFFKGPSLESVAPPKKILMDIKNGVITQEEYSRKYKAFLNSCFPDFKVLIDRIEFMSNGRDVALCCFEKPRDFCHRHILADMINQQLSLGIEEWKEQEEILCNPLF